MYNMSIVHGLIVGMEESNDLVAFIKGGKMIQLKWQEITQIDS